MLRTFFRQLFGMSAVATCDTADSNSGHVDPSIFAQFNASSGPVPPIYQWRISFTIWLNGRAQWCKAIPQGEQRCRTQDFALSPAQIDSIVQAARVAGLPQQPMAEGRMCKLVAASPGAASASMINCWRFPPVPAMRTCDGKT